MLDWQNALVKDATFRKIRVFQQAWFIIKCKNFLMHNWRIETLISKTGKSSKKISMYVTKKTLTKREIWKKFTESLSYEKIANLLNELGDEDNEVLLEKMMEIIKKKKSFI